MTRDPVHQSSGPFVGLRLLRATLRRRFGRSLRSGIESITHERSEDTTRQSETELNENGKSPPRGSRPYGHPTEYDEMMSSVAQRRGSSR